MLYRCVYSTHSHTHTHWNIITRAKQTPWIIVGSAHHCSEVRQKLHQVYYFSTFIKNYLFKNQTTSVTGATGQIHTKCKQVPNNQREVASASYQLWLWFFCSAGSPVIFTCRKKFSKKSMPISKLKWEPVNAEYCYQTTVQHLYCREFQTSQELETA